MRHCSQLLGLLLAAFALTWSAWRAEAQEYCVSCTEPSALYRCVIDGARPGGSQPLQMLCVTSMAKAGGHATCGIKRGTVFDCDGAVKHVPWTAAAAPAEPGPPQPPPARPGPPPVGEPAPKPATQEPPKTMVDLAKQANEQTTAQIKKTNENIKESMKSTGQAIGDATKKTWNCMISFFTRC